MKNIFFTQGHVSRLDRNQKFKHRSFIIWFTGLSGSGKSTLSQALENYLFSHGYATYVIDGDNLRHGLCSDLSFESKDRHENIRRVAEVSKLMIDAGLIVMTAFISPYEVDRKLAKARVDQDDFIEIYCNCSLEICEQRDVKGLYKKARQGTIKNFTGIGAPYEVPLKPDLSINTGLISIDESISIIIDYLKKHSYIK
jgi:adenylylsulfate kinase